MKQDIFGLYKSPLRATYDPLRAILTPESDSCYSRPKVPTQCNIPLVI
jgi:hypothetical protein